MTPTQKETYTDFAHTGDRMTLGNLSHQSFNAYANFFVRHNYLQFLNPIRVVGVTLITGFARQPLTQPFDCMLKIAKVLTSPCWTIPFVLLGLPVSVNG